MALAPGNLPRLADIGLDLPVLLFTLVVSVVAGLLFGAIPVVQVRRRAARDGAPRRRADRDASRERHRARNILVVAQIALALVLLSARG